MNKETQQTMFSSTDTSWETPPEFFNLLERRFGKFTLDPCATVNTAKCKQCFTEEEDGLTQSWVGNKVFMNPPYGRGISTWLKKAYEESLQGDTTVVCLIPVRTDTQYWHEYCMKAAEIHLVKGRLKFLIDGEAIASAPFPSAVIVFNGEHNRPYLFAMERK